ncbi:transmembrane protein 131-like [Striga asiatica]|uniref:Transmembrane protein 131-like n=1 Tax=Striga asiatica TaxID=4170 RepID=A0A5A7PS92_STRAF|nr:transmembrane protein 131-like [Striga asiatica]
MASKTLMIKAHKKQLSHMFYHRGLFSSAKDVCFLVVFLSAVFILAVCEPCAVKEVQNQCKFEGCRNFDSQGVADGYVGSASVLRNPVRQHYSQNLCHPSDLFCFPSTLSVFEDDEIGAELEELDASELQSEGFSSVLKGKRNLNELPYQGNFRFLCGRKVSCYSYQEDGFPELSSGESISRNGLRTDVSSCVNPLLDKTIDTNGSSFSFEDGLSTPPVEINPSVLNWGHRNMYHSSLAYLNVTNLDKNNVLRIYDPSSSDPQFYPCDSSDLLLAPGENASICFVFLPTRLGLASAKLIIQTSLGGFLIQGKGFSVESPYQIHSEGSLDISPGSRRRKSLSLFNSLDETLHVEELTAWISISSGNNNTSRLSKSICRAHHRDYSSDYNVLNAKDWLAVERGGGDGKPLIALRPRENWVIGPKKTETFVELDISGHFFEGKIVGALCMKLLRTPNSEIETVVVPLEVEMSLEKTALKTTGLVSLSLETLAPCKCNTSKSARVALSLRNDAPYSLRLTKVNQDGESKASFEIKSLEGIILFPNATTQVAFVHYANMETREVDPSCKITVLVNDTSFSRMEIPCSDVIGVCSGCLLESSVGYTQRINVDYVNGGERFFSSGLLPHSSVKVENTRESDELILKNWKSQSTVSSLSILDKKDILFPVVLVGNYSSQWITVKNPTQKPIVMQLILNSVEVINNCRIPEILLQPSSSNTLVGNNNTIGPTKYGFSIAKDSSTEAFIHPYGVATLGPIIFQPSNRCEWKSSALIRNNLSGVEWLSLQAFGGSLSLVLHEGHDYPVQSLEFKSNLSSKLNFSFPETLKTSYCSQSMTKEVFAKNTGDIPLEVVRIKVSGAECGLDGFVVHNCAGFSLQPGEQAKLHISYSSDFTSATVKRDLELVSTAGILVVPMEASIVPTCSIDFCRRSIFWMRVKKAIVVLIFAASLIYFIVSLLFPHMNNNTASAKWNSLNVSHNWKIAKSVSSEEALLLECCDPSSEISSPSSVLNLDTEHKIIEPCGDLRVRVGKEKGKRSRRKKKSSGLAVLLSEASSSQSGNSTPSSPLSPTGACTSTPKRKGENPVIEAKNPFSQRSKGPENLSKVNKLVDNTEVSSKSKLDKDFAHEKSVLTRKVASKAAVVPSAAVVVPSATVVVPSAASSNSPIAPHSRAPGAKLQSRKKVECEEEQNYTYDIWGNHLFGHHLAYQSREVSSKPSSSSSAENDSDSFFVRGPQTLIMNNTLLQSVISDLKGNE